MTYITEVTHTQSGTTNRDFIATFPFIDTTDIRVQLNGVSKSLNTDYTIVQSGANTVINFNTAPANNDTIRIFRDTDIDSINSTFAAGSSITSTDLNNNNRQLLYAAQEFGTLKEDNSVSFTLGDKGDVQVNSSTDWVIQNNVIENANMADASVGNNELIDGSITGAKLASLSISTAQIATDAITVDKIANNAVGGDQIATNAVGEGELSTNAVSPTKINQTAAPGWGFTPAGTVIWYAGSSAPTGYLKANGDSIPNGSGTVQGVSADFSGLYAIVGANLPDLRGEFIRGFDDGREVDANRTIRSAQTDTIKVHTHPSCSTDTQGGHSHTTNTAGDHNHSISRGQAESPGGDETATSISSGGQADVVGYTNTLGAGGHSHSMDTQGAHTHTVTISNNADGGTETKPRNIALLACIKY